MHSASTYLTRTLLALTTAACGEPQPATAPDVRSDNGGTSNTGVPPSTDMPEASGIAADAAAAEEMASSSAMTGSGAPVSPDPYAPRSGSFRMLVYSQTAGFRHDSITQGKVMLQEIAAEHGFEITEAETNELITPEALTSFEIVFFMNTTGDIFSPAEESAFQSWMETKNGAFAGTHSATDTEQGWAYYQEVTGQSYNGHGDANEAGAIRFEADMLEFPAVAGLPNPWQRNEEWYIFASSLQWAAKPGFMILGRKQADNQPFVWAREFGNWRSFYTAIGHDAAAFRDPIVKQHVTGGILWAVRRDHQLP